VPVKTALIYAPSENPETSSCIEPLGLCYIGAVAKERGHQVEILDLRPSRPTDEDVIARLANDPPEVVGFSSILANFSRGVALAAKIKSAFGSTIVFGGPYPSGCPELIQESPIDFLAIGEGEETFSELLDHLRAPTGSQLSMIPGLVYENNGRTVKTEPRPRIKDLDSLPLPMRDGLPISSYRFEGYRRPHWSKRVYLSVMSTRGCPHDCYFCANASIWGRKVSRRSVAPVVDEISMLIADYKMTNLFFQDEDFLIHKQSAIDLCKGIVDAELDFSWKAFACVDRIDREVCQWLSRAKCESLFLGIETLAPEGLKQTGKNIDLPEVVEAVQLMNKHDILPHLHFMFGFPWEDEQSVAATFRKAKKIPMILFNASIATPFPGTALYDDVIREGLLEETDFSKFNIMFATMRTRHLSRQYLQKVRKNFYFKIIFRPVYFLRLMRLLLTDFGFFRLVAREVRRILYSLLPAKIRGKSTGGRDFTPWRLPAD
jgi:radical SAM superfamily enzyme YgiQ (UPF0313 family)